jgi:hypothetical protein
MFGRTAALVYFLLFLQIQCIAVTGSIEENFPIEPTAKILIDGKKSYFLTGNEFSIPNLSDGIHSMQIVSHKWAFERIRLEAPIDF